MLFQCASREGRYLSTVHALAPQWVKHNGTGLNFPAGAGVYDAFSQNGRTTYRWQMDTIYRWRIERYIQMTDRTTFTCVRRNNVYSWRTDKTYKEQIYNYLQELIENLQQDGPSSCERTEEQLFTVTDGYFTARWTDNLQADKCQLLTVTCGQFAQDERTVCKTWPTSIYEWRTDQYL